MWSAPSARFESRWLVGLVGTPLPLEASSLAMPPRQASHGRSTVEQRMIRCAPGPRPQSKQKPLPVPPRKSGPLISYFRPHYYRCANGCHGCNSCTDPCARFGFPGKSLASQEMNEVSRYWIGGLAAARTLPDRHLLWHTELLRNGSRLTLGVDLLNLCLQIASDRRLLSARVRGLSASGGQPALFEDRASAG
jgi:hypothetical protein